MSPLVLLEQCLRLSSCTTKFLSCEQGVHNTSIPQIFGLFWGVLVVNVFIYILHYKWTEFQPPPDLPTMSAIYF